MGFISWIISNIVFLQVVCILVSAIFLIATAVLMVRVDYFSDKRDYGLRAWSGAKGDKKVSYKAWKRILQKVASDNPVLWRQALVDGGQLLFETLKAAGYRASSLEEILYMVDQLQIPNVEEVRRLHSKAQIVIADETMAVTHGEVKEILRAYRELLRQFGVVE